jgi:hypothetical protein
MKTTRTSTIMLAIAAVLTLGAAAAYAQEQVRMSFSGTSASSVINLLQPNTGNSEDNFAGTSSLGSFTLRNVRAISNTPSTSSTCTGANYLFFTELAGAGILRFQDGSLLYLQLVPGEGGDCINIAATTTGATAANCALTFQITGGTGRFKNASGTLNFTETVYLVATDSTGYPVYFAATGELKGAVSGVSWEHSQGGGQ